MTGNIGDRKRVFIVDDSSTMRALVDGILSEDPNFLVVGVARSAKEAMMMLHAARPQVLLTDMCMPEIDGAGLLAMLKGHHALTKVVMSSRANLTDAVEKKVAALGATAIIDKQDIARDPKAFLAALNRSAGCEATKAAPLRVVGASTVVQAAARFPLPNDEAARVRAIASLNVANLDVDPRLNILARHLARLSQYPVAAINVMGADQLWIKAAVGIAPSVVPRGDSVCARAICAHGVTVITDLLADPVLRTLPCVTGGPNLRSYVGAPILSQNGVRLGMACIADMQPRYPTREITDIVTDVAALVATALQSPLMPSRSAA